MPSTLTRICFAALLACAGLMACAGLPAYAAGMPDTGTKNFVPGGDAPAYLVNENLTVAPGSPGQSPLGTAYNEPTGPAPGPASVARSPQTRTIGHGRRAGRRIGTHRSAAARTARIKGRPVRAAGATALRTRTIRTRTVRERSSAALGRSPRRSRFEHNAAAARRRTGTAKHARASVRHVAAKSASRRG